MASDKSEKPKISLDVSIGKEIDAALGDVIRGLLKKPAEEAGNLLTAGIGIIGDHIARKREINASLGMEEVRKILEADGVEMKDITPPKEEEIHLILNGMSLADDQSVRNLWAGLFAKALEPNSDVIAERPFISILESLSPLDAKMIDLLAFAQLTDSNLKDQTKKFTPMDYKSITPIEKEQMSTVQEENSAMQKEAIASIRDKAENYGLIDIKVPSWADNLMRLGIVERPPIHPSGRSSNFGSTIHDESDILPAFNQLHSHLQETEEIAKWKASPPERLLSKNMFGHKLNVELQLTRWGKRFVEACGLC